MLSKEFYSQFMNRQSLVFDIGANLGNRTDIFAELAGHVVAVEPQEYCCSVLQKKHDSHSVTIVQAVLGEQQGTAKLRQIDPKNTWNCVSSLSDRWIDAVSKEGRFGEVKWNKEIEVHMTTLDHLIAVHGDPDFVKIDVEGYEPEVIRGCHRKLKAFSFEFTPCTLDMVSEVLTHIRQFSSVEVNYSMGESLDLVLIDWTTPEKVIEHLQKFKGDNVAFGDVYVRAI